MTYNYLITEDSDVNIIFYLFLFQVRCFDQIMSLIFIGFMRYIKSTYMVSFICNNGLYKTILFTSISFKCIV